MNKALFEASDEYDLPSNGGIHSISTVDANIISKLSSILLSLDSDSNLIELVKKWKSVPDEDILEELKKLDDELEQSGEDVKKKVIDFIDIEGNIITVKSLSSIQKVDSYDIKRTVTVYKILINKSDSPHTRNANIEIVFEDWADREICLQDLKEKLSGFTNIRFL